MLKDSCSIDEFLPCSTPQAWLDQASNNMALLLVDHAHCEKKAAATAMHFIHQYPSHYQLLQKMTRIAREELLHLQKVSRLLEQRQITYQPISPSRYASGMREGLASGYPERLVDLLIIGAFIEARSCERFRALLPYLDDKRLYKFYESLFNAEQRHFQEYLALAHLYEEGDQLEKRLQHFYQLEYHLITSTDEQFRFHSGVPI